MALAAISGPRASERGVGHSYASRMVILCTYFGGVEKGVEGKGGSRLLDGHIGSFRHPIAAVVVPPAAGSILSKCGMTFASDLAGLPAQRGREVGCADPPTQGPGYPKCWH